MVCRLLSNQIIQEISPELHTNGDIRNFYVDNDDGEHLQIFCLESA